MQEVQIQRLSLHTVNLALASRYTILEEKVLQGLGEHQCGGAGSATYSLLFLVAHTVIPHPLQRTLGECGVVVEEVLKTDILHQ